MCLHPLIGSSPSPNDSQQRIIALDKLHTTSKTLIVSSLFASLHLSLCKSEIQNNSLHVSIGEEYDFEELCTQLTSMGYERFNIYAKQDLQIGQFMANNQTNRGTSRQAGASRKVAKT